MSEGWIAIGVIFAVVLIMAAFQIGRDRGRDDIREEIERDSEQAERDRDKIDEDVAGRPDEQIDRDLDKWHRD